MVQQLGPKLANLPPLSGDQPPVEQITETTRWHNLSNRGNIGVYHYIVRLPKWGKSVLIKSSWQASKLRWFENTTDRVKGVKCRASSVAKNYFGDPWSVDAPCCEISQFIISETSQFVSFSLTCPRQLLCFVAEPNHSAQSPLHPEMTHFQPNQPSHWAWSQAWKALLEMIQLPPKLRACHLQGGRGWRH